MNGYRASSPCTPRCVTHRVAPVPVRETVRRYAALTAALAGGEPLGEKARRVLAALGVALDADTDRLSVPGEKGTLIVANHTSWLDIVALLAVEPPVFLAKREVRDWPWIGRRADELGTVFLDRWALRALPEGVATLARALREGRTVAVFPEATTWCAPPGGPFRRAVFQAALDADAPVRPVALSYFQGDAPTRIAAFVGDDPLARSIGRVARASDLTVRVRTSPASTPSALSDLWGLSMPAPDRRTLAVTAQRAVRDLLPTSREPTHA